MIRGTGECLDEFLGDIEEDVRSARGYERQLIIIIEALAEETGVVAKLRVYANGVPLDDIEMS